MAGSYTVKKKKKLLQTYRHLDKIINVKKKDISSKGKKNMTRFEIGRVHSNEKDCR